MAGRRILGVDLGIASIGWAIIEIVDNAFRLVRIGVWEWDAPEHIENGSKRTSNLKDRGEARRRRRLLDVRRKRMREVRRLLAEHGVLNRTDRDALHFAKLNPWHLRKEALDRRLNEQEWAAVLAHMAGHRAYLSNSKRKKNEPHDDTKKLLIALSENEREFETARREGRVRTVGEWLASQDRQRNRTGDYRHSIRREWVEQEATLLFIRQREFQNPFTHSSLRESYLPLAFEQGEIKSLPVGPCTFEPHAPRAAKHSYSFERFRLLQRLTNIRIISAPDASVRSLTQDEIRKIDSKLGLQAKISYKTVRRLLHLPASDTFTKVNGAEQEDYEIIRGTKSGESAPGIRAMRATIISHFGAPVWQSMVTQPDTLDAIASAIAHSDDLKLIRADLAKLDIPPEIVETLVKESDGGELGFFKGTGHLSIKALRKLTPHMLAGADYHNAQIAADYDPSMDRYARRPGIVGSGPQAVAAWLKKPQLEEIIRNQVVSRAVREGFKQVLALWQSEGPFDAIHLEMAREVGKGAKERDEIDNENKRRRDRRTVLRNSFIENFKGRRPTDREFERWALWSEQQGKCPYTPFSRAHIPCDAVLDGDDRVDVDHILPRSRFKLESLDNKILCLKDANQNKGSHTPYEWMSNGGGQLKWEEFCAQAKVIFKQNPRKLGNLLIVDTAKLEKSLSSRALNDTRWIAKFLLAGFEKLGTTDQPVRVQPVNAALVGTLRWAWGLAGWKHNLKDRSERRSDERHHAIDAAIVGTIDASLVNRLTKAYQRAEERGDYFEARAFRPLSSTFREDLLNTLYGKGVAKTKPSEFVPDSRQGTLVSRGERRRARGQMHKETIYGLTTISNEKSRPQRTVKTEAKAVDETLTIEHLSRVKDAERNYKLVNLLREWIDKGRPLDAKPVWKYRLPDGSERYEPIRSISLLTNEPPAITPRRLRRKNGDTELAFASFDRINMVRVDVFKNGDADGASRYLFVPVYVNQTVESAPSQRVFTLRRPYNDWPLIGENDKFLFSLYKFSLVYIEATGRPASLGYFRGLDTNDGRVKLTPQFSRDEKLSVRYSPTTIRKLQKFTVDRLGRKFEVTREVRTWRGKACT